jgi:hypothetical protein
MRRLSSWAVLAFLIAGASAIAGEPAPPPPPPAGEEPKPKTEEELLWDKIAEALLPLKTVMELAEEAKDKAWEKSEADLIALGPKAIPLYETLLARKDEKEKIVFSEKLKELLGREDIPAENMIKRVLRAQGWVSEAERKKREWLLLELKDPENPAGDLSSPFIELGPFGVAGLKEEFGKAKDPKIREKILQILNLMASQGCLDVPGFLLDLSVDKDAEVRRKAAAALCELARPDEEEETLKALEALKIIFRQEEAYPMFAGMLRLDADPDVRAYAAQVLGRMGVKEAAQELVNALDDPKEKVYTEAANSLRLFEKTTPFPKDWDKLVKSLKTWWGQAKASYPAQLVAAPPVRKSKPAGKKDGAGAGGK